VGNARWQPGERAPGHVSRKKELHEFFPPLACLTRGAATLLACLPLLLLFLSSFTPFFLPLVCGRKTLLFAIVKGRGLHSASIHWQGDAQRPLFTRSL
jgi:hypothetical protein